MNTNIKLTALTADQFTQADSFYASGAAKAIATDYFNYVYSSALQYLETGDVQILNRITLASRLVHKVKITKSLIAIFSGHKCNKQGKYAGKANATKLTKVRDDLDSMKKALETAINNANSIKAKPVADFSAEKHSKQGASWVRKAIDNGMTRDAVMHVILSQLNELDMESADDTATVAAIAA